jgi:hypothetical protein
MKLLHNLFVEHDAVAWLIVLWGLTVPLYIGLQAWFGLAWEGRWRTVALIPLIGVVLAIALAAVFQVIAARITPDWPPFQPSDILVAPILGVVLSAPLGFIYEAIAGIVRLSRRKAVAITSREQ